MSGKIVSLLFVVFCTNGVQGSRYAGKLFGKHLSRTAILYLIDLTVCYILFQNAGASLIWLVGIVVLWEPWIQVGLSSVKSG
ncbi:hypothetical protein [Brevibacillus porteri]|uniref:hypothetical protein n=1 Tax=Brevibacillus porteri TaxID=2126350 RepID=UPI003D20EF1F